MAEPIARSPIPPRQPVTVTAGWEVSAFRADGDLTLTDCTPLAKVLVRAPAAGRMAGELDAPFGRAARDQAGILVVGSGPGEWLLLAPPGQAADLAGRFERLAGRGQDEPVSVVDLTHGRALMRLTGPRARDVLSAVCGIDLSEAISPNGAAFRTSVAALATEVIRDDLAGVRSYLLHCERSSGRYLFGALLSAGRDFGIEIDGFTTPGILKRRPQSGCESRRRSAGEIHVTGSGLAGSGHGSMLRYPAEMPLPFRQILW